jgi:hypothetical protein
MFSIRALGHDYDSTDPKPLEPLEWVQRRQVAEQRQCQVLRAGIATVLAAVLGGVSCPLIQYLIGIFGH